MSDDLLATPLNKLPPPVVISKTDNGGAVSVPNYNDLRDSISIPTADDTRFQPQQQQQQQYYEQQQQQQYYEQQPMTPGPQQHYYEQQPALPHYAPSIPPTLKKKKKQGPFFSTDTLKDKKLWLFAAIVFLLYTYGLPKLSVMFPSFVDPVTMSLKAPAIASASLMSGLLYMFVSEFV